MVLGALNTSAQIIKIPKSKADDKKIGTLKEEVILFINKVDAKYNKISDYFVYVIHVNAVKKDCEIYTIGFIFNESDYSRVNPEYIISDSNHTIVVSFSSFLKDTIIPGYKCVKIDYKKECEIKDKLIKEEKGYITGVFYGLEYKKCEGIIEKTFYENSDLIPAERSIFQMFPSGVIEKIREGK
jgi:hypothetical protein